MSLFSLKTSQSELEGASEGVARISYEQKGPSRTISASNFSNGVISIPFQVSGNKWWIPSLSYLKIRCGVLRALGADATQTILYQTQVAPSMGLGGTLFQSCSFRLNGTTISTLGDYIPQVDAINTRMTKSKPWLDGFGNAVNKWEHSYEKRRQEIINVGVDDDTYVATERIDLGFDAATNQIAIAADTGVITFTQNGGAALPVLATYWSIGDIIELDIDAATRQRYRINVVSGAATLTASLESKTVAVLAAGLNFRRLRPTPSQRANNFEITWTPPLSIFNINHALPAGDYELVLNPQTVSALQNYAMESNVSTFVGGTTATFVVDTLHMYVATVEGSRVDDLTYYIDLEQTRCQSSDITANATGGENHFDVSPTTNSLTVAFQDNRVGTQARVPSSKFRCGDAAYAFGSELELSNFYLNFAGQNKPTPNADPDQRANKDYLTQLYVDGMLNNELALDTAGPESFVDWKERGMYLHYQWPRDGTDRSTRATVKTNFNVGQTNSRVLLFDRFRQVAVVHIQNGRVISVQLEDA